MFSLYTDAELDALIAQVKAAIPKALAGQLTRVDDTEFLPTEIDKLQALGTNLAREKSRRSGRSSRFVTLRLPRERGPRGRF